MSQHNALLMEIESAEAAYGGGGSDIQIDSTHKLLLYRLDRIESGQTDILSRLDDVTTRVIHLENDAKLTRWIFAGIGGLTVIVVKDLLFPLLKNEVLPNINLLENTLDMLLFLC